MFLKFVYNTILDSMSFGQNIHLSSKHRKYTCSDKDKYNEYLNRQPDIVDNRLSQPKGQFSEKQAMTYIL